jgi:diguanylate cyclase (GGDEF)-like protein
MFLDLDHFKEVNDTLGHLQGDHLLREAALRLTHCVRESDMIARLGGDEFIILMTEFEDTAAVERVAEAILQRIELPFHLGYEQVFVSASIGITLYPDDATNIEGLLKNADQAMYESKRLGRNRFNYFRKEMQEASLNRIKIANELRTAIVEQQFELYYQPIVDLKTGVTHKAEALIRWDHPVRGMVLPGTFISIAEETGLIIPIGNWVFEQAAKQTAYWQKTYNRKIEISVNKSPVQFRENKDPLKNWKDYLSSIKLNGGSIIVEITEGLLLDANEKINAYLIGFRDAGIHVSLDDFGTGYSSLAYLKKFDIDYLKIDQSFVKGLSPTSSDMALCEAIIVMAHKLGMRVIAEGIETQEQCDLLTQANCDFGQGYLFSRPISAADFETRYLSKGL